MDCQEIKKIIPRYFQHTASEEEVKQVEEHLCVCHECRVALGELMDKVDEAVEPAAQEGKEETIHIIPESSSEEQPAEEPPQSQPEKPVEEPAEEPVEKPVEEPAKVQPQEELRDISGGEEKIEYFPGGDLEEKTADKKEGDSSIEEEIKPFFEEGEKKDSVEKSPEPEPQEQREEPVEAAPSEQAEEKNSDFSFRGAEEYGSKPVEEPEPEKKSEGDLPKEEAPDLPENLSLEKESKIGSLEYTALIMGVGVLGLLIYLLLKG